jgi:hypothetical protein
VIFALDETVYDNGDGWISRGTAERDQLIEHREGVPWHEAPVPSRWHRCTPQTRGLLADVERCACGAIRSRHGLGSGSWGERNSRKRS